jgi:hypothetical protein
MARKQWKSKEERDAKAFLGRPTPRSGGLWFAKGDSKSEKFLIENKTTAKENFTIQGKVWEKIYKEALIESKMPLLSIEFGEKKTELVALDINDFIAIIEELEEKKKELRYISENS